MWKVPVASFVALAAFAWPAHALELKNPHAVFGPFGQERPDKRYVPGDVLFVNFEIVDIQVDPKTNLARYHVTMELVDSKGGLVFSRNKNEDVTLALGGNRLPAFADVIIGIDQSPGTYTLKVTVRDVLSKDTKVFAYDFEILPPGFGFVRVFSPAAGFTGQSHMIHFAIIGMAKDEKKIPNVDVHMHVLDESGKAVYSQASAIPKDLPEEALSKLATLPFIDGLQYGMFLNRPGSFIIELEGTDKLAKKSTKVRFPLTVRDISSLSSK